MEKDNRQYSWHSSVVDYEVGVALILRPSVDDEDVLEVAAVPLAELLEQTLEFIGTNVNGNPYGNVWIKYKDVCLLSDFSENVILVDIIILAIMSC